MLVKRGGLLFVVVFYLLFVSQTNALYCDTMNETTCLHHQQNTFYSVSSCDTLLNCRPVYTGGSFSHCQTLLRTNLSDCSAFPTENCYNDVMYAEQQRDCGCGKGTEFKLQDGCGQPGNWSGICLDITSCETETRTYYGQERTVHINCDEITFDPASFDQSHCDMMPQERRRCRDNDTVAIYALEYMIDECSENHCALSSIELSDEIECGEDERCTDGLCEKSKIDEKEEKKTLRSYIPKIFDSEKESDSENASDTETGEDQTEEVNTRETIQSEPTDTTQNTDSSDQSFSRITFFTLLAGVFSVIGLGGILIGLRSVKKRT